MIAFGRLDQLVAGDRSAAQFVSALQEYAVESYAANHPLLLAISAAEFRDLPGAIRRFLGQYYVYSYGFTRYLGAVIANLESPEHRTLLIHNSVDEIGRMDERHVRELRSAGIDPRDTSAPHPELFGRFLRAIGVDALEAVQRPLVSTTAWIQTFHDVCLHASQAQAVGALGIATEGIVPPMYRRMLTGIRAAWPDMSTYDRAFFDLHAAVDDDHASVLRQITSHFCESPGGRREVAVGVLKALRARAAFFDEMLVVLRRHDEESRAA